MPDDKDQAAETQPDATPSEQQESVSVETPGSDSGTQSDSASDSQDLGQAVPPELEETKKNLLRDYHEKMASVKQEKEQFQSELAVARKDSATLQRLLQQEWFKQAVESEKARKAGSPLSFELTDDQFEAARTDKRTFLELTKQIAQKVIESTVGDKLSHLSERTEALSSDREFERTAREYGDEFKTFKDAGKLDSYLKQGYDYETAFAKAKLAERGKSPDDVSKKAEELLRQRKQQVTEKDGKRASGSRVIKAKTFDEAISRSLDALLQGDKDFKLAKG